MKLFTLTILITCFFVANIFASTPSSSSADNALNVTVEVNNTFCGGCFGSINLNVTGGELPYTYTWSTGQTTEDIDNLCLGFYQVTVSDALGCSFTEGNFLDNENLLQVVLETQFEVDEFVQDFFNCSDVFLNLRIGTPFSAPPSDISDISGLSFLTSVGANLLIQQNPNLTSLEGLQNITSVGSSIQIIGNDALTDLTNFPALTQINSSLRIDNCSGLTSLTGLEQITLIENDLYLSNLTNLTTLNALSNLQSVGKDLDIRICLDLESLDGLEQVNTVGEQFILRDNISLTDISALDHLISIGQFLVLENNTSLSACSVESICQYLESNFPNSISNNTGACNSESDILQACNALEFIVAISPISCAGDCDGEINLSVISGGTPPFTYDWSNGQTGNPISNLCAGLYEVTVTDALGTSTSIALELTEPAPLDAQVNIFQPACFGICDGSIIVTAIGGTAPFDYSNLMDLCPGDNELLVTDYNGCTATVTFFVPGTEAIEFNLDSIIDAENGMNNGAIAVTLTSDTTVLSYEWFVDGIMISTEEDPENLAPGAYTLIVSSPEGCSAEYGPFDVGPPVSVETFSLEEEITVFPNPAQDNIYFTNPITEDIPFEFWNTQGQLVHIGSTKQNSGRHSIDLTRVSVGIYFLKLKIGSRTIIKKVIKL